MLNYLIVQLCDTSVSFCHYSIDKNSPCLIDYNTLKEAIVWSMKENVFLQFVYPEYELPHEYKNLIASVEHADIVPSSCADSNLRDNAEVVVFNSWDSLYCYPLAANQTYVIRTSISELLDNSGVIDSVIPKISRLNVIVTDIKNFNDQVQTKYADFLDRLGTRVSKEYFDGHGVQISILTDRMILDSMNNCGAGYQSVTLSPDGKFYVCPGFYFDGSENIGSISAGVAIRNPQLFKIEYAPICRICDAWHCKRCVWMNKSLTLEVNTPSHEQCAMAHTERNASRNLLAKIRNEIEFMPGKEIPALSYIDPYEEILNQGK